MPYALINPDSGVVQQVEPVLPDPPNPQDTWIECPPEVTPPDGDAETYWLYENGQFRQWPNLDEARREKAIEVRQHADGLVINAWSNPETTLLDIDPDQWRRLVESRRDERNDIRAEGGTLTDEQRAEARSDMRLGEYQRRVAIAENQARANLQQMNNVDNIRNATMDQLANWPVWVPYDNPVATDMDADGLIDMPLPGQGPRQLGRARVTQDADSYNIDLDGDGDADLIIPKDTP